MDSFDGTKCPLHIRWKQVSGPDTLVGRIDAELERLEQVCAVTACHVTLSGSKAHYHLARVTVSLELRGGACVSHSAQGADLMAAVTRAFADTFLELALH